MALEPIVTYSTSVAFSPGGQGKPGFPVFLGCSCHPIKTFILTVSLIILCCVAVISSPFSPLIDNFTMRDTAPLLYTEDAAKHDTAHCEEASPSWHPLVKKKERIDQSGEATVMTLPSSDWSGGCQEGAKGSHSALGFTPIKSKHHYQRHRKNNNKTNSAKLACLNCSHF